VTVLGRLRRWSWATAVTSVDADLDRVLHAVGARDAISDKFRETTGDFGGAPLTRVSGMLRLTVDGPPARACGRKRLVSRYALPAVIRVKSIPTARSAIAAASLVSSPGS
jgi:hypothetical protein